ncbi:MAG: CPBP family intramembrane metalloprotease [Cellulomonadaceae bacterium]|nr:CPBP family intramembrane metalloprotease [Cellulomonadaceae bacterium]
MVEDEPLAGTDRRRAVWEIGILLALSLGRSGVYAVVALIVRLTAKMPLGDQTATLNPSLSPRPGLDLAYQLLSIGFGLVPVLLATYFLAVRRGAQPARQAIGLSWRGWDIGWGAALACAVGIPGLLFFTAGRALGITVAVEASALGSHWWSIPVLVLAAFQNGALEEVIVVAYLFARTRNLGWNRRRTPSGLTAMDWRFVTFSAILRGSYHLYQGIGPFIGNAVMGVLFVWFYRSRWGRQRVIPLVIAHTLLDTVAFIGYAVAPDSWLRALGLA